MLQRLLKRSATDVNTCQSLTAASHKKQKQRPVSSQSLTALAQIEIFPMRKEDFPGRLQTVPGVTQVEIQGDLVRVTSQRYPWRFFEMELTQHAELPTSIVTVYENAHDCEDSIGEGWRILKAASKGYIVDEFAVQVEQKRLVSMVLDSTGQSLTARITDA